MEVRVGSEGDLDRMVETLTGAFGSDPLWSWAFPEHEALAAWWRLFVTSALRYPCVWIAGDCDAVAAMWRDAR